MQTTQKVSVIGLGTLGTPITIQAAHYGNDVKGYNPDPEVFQKTIGQIQGRMKFLS